MINKHKFSRLLVAAFAISGSVCVHGAVAAESDPPESGAIVEQYLKASIASQEAMRGMSMSVEMHASIPRLDREGGMKATRTVSATGEVSYTGMTFDGNDSIKREVIARFLQADVEASKQPSIGITPANYKFKYYGVYGSGDWQLHLFELTPKRKAPGLFKGWLWVEAKTGLPVREEGRFVKNPSVFLKRWDFARDYDIRSGTARLSYVTSTVVTRIVGEAKGTIHYDSYVPAAPVVATKE